MTARTHDLTLSRRFGVPRQDVWRAWTTCETDNQWSAPEGFTISQCRIDARAGGTWEITMRQSSGESLTVGGTYREVQAPERLVSTHAWRSADGSRGHETVMTVDLAERDGGTEMTLRQTGFDSAESRDGHRDGWSQCFDKLDAYLATHHR